MGPVLVEDLTPGRRDPMKSNARLADLERPKNDHAKPRSLAAASFGSLLAAACTIWNGVALPPSAGAGDASAANEYASEVKASNPIAYWRFEPGPDGGTDRVIRDVSGRGRDCTSSPGVAFEPGPLPGSSSARLGAGDALFCSSDDAFAFPGLSAFSFEGFVSHDVDGPREKEELRLVFDRMGGSGPSDRLGYYAFLQRPANTDEWSLNFQRWRGAGDFHSVGAPAHAELGPGTWAHFVMTQDTNGRLALYLDGSRRAEATALAAPPPSNVQLVFGRNQNGSCCTLMGKLAEVAIYDRALDEATVARHYRAAFPETR